MSDKATALAPGRLRTALGLFATGVTVVSARDPANGEPRGMTANAFMSVSLDPPLVLVSVRRNAHLRDVLVRAGAYGVGILGAGREREARRFAGLPVATHEPPPEFTDRAGVPVLSGVIAWIVADVVSTFPGGDHTLFVGEVRDLDVVAPGEPPLVFHRSVLGGFAPPSSAEPLPLGPWEGLVDAWG